jgi:hypothetical protein
MNHAFPISILRGLLLSMALLAAQAFAAGFDHSAWDALLKAHVVEISSGQSTQVNYAGFARDRAKLKAYLSSLGGVQRTSFDAWPKPDRLAFLINAYNAWTVEYILTKYPDLKSIKDLGSFLQSPWKKKFIPLLGQTVALDDIEHGMIRAENAYTEPRIHFAVNCASVGCPALRTEAFTGEKLTQQLDDSARKFLADRSRNRLSNGKLELSSIFKWYREDFERGWGGYKSLFQFLGDYAPSLGLSAADKQKLDAKSLPLSFLDYDWKLNVKK